MQTKEKSKSSFAVKCILVVFLGAATAFTITRAPFTRIHRMYGMDNIQTKTKKIGSYAYLAPGDWNIKVSYDRASPQVEWKGAFFDKYTLLPYIKGTKLLLVEVSPDVARNTWLLGVGNPPPTALSESEMLETMYIPLEYSLATHTTARHTFGLQIRVRKNPKPVESKPAHTNKQKKNLNHKTP